MSNDNKTLADVQPGGRVRLGNVRDRVMGECEQWFDTTDVDMEAATDSIIAAAQPSPGGHGSITVDDLSQVIRQVDGNHTLGAGSLAEAILAKLPHLAARQPVGEPVAWMTQHDEPMLFPTAAEAADYCEDDEQPVPLFRSPAQAVDLPYSLDSDPAGIRARVADVITGTMMVGAQGHTPPPAGHWAEPFWNAARADAAAQAVDLDELRRAVCVVNVVGQIDGHDVVRRNSLLDVIDDRRQRLTESQAVQP